MAGDHERARVFSRRSVLIGGMQTTLFSLLAGRLYYLAVIEGEKYRTMADENRINLRLIAPQRGQIVDRAGAPLAINQQNYRVVLLPEQVEDVDLLLNKLNGYVEISDADRKRVLRDMRNDASLNAVMVKDNLTWDQVAQVSLHTLDLPGTDIDTGEVRSYTFGLATSHVLGYVGTVSENEMKEDDEDDSDDDEGLLSIPGFRIGKSGIEKQYDLDLRGEAGEVQMEVNAHGRVVRELAHNDPKPGRDLRLTLDIGLQQFAQQVLAKEEGAAAVVLDVHTGAVMALVSQPGFDPNLFTYGISQDDWNKLNNDEHSPLLNKVISGVYAPGSSIKPMIALAGLEADILNPDAQTFCPGYYDMGEYRFHCWKHGGHGHVNMREAMAGSCDVFFYDLGHRLGIDRIQTMAKRLGLGQKLGIDLPHERAGLVPGRTWKLATHGGLWEPGETLIAAIGQGYMLASPLQLAVMAARIANGGKAVTPHLIVPNNPPPAPALGFDEKHLALVRGGMYAVVNEQIGTAYAARTMNTTIQMAGKTGTSQVRRISEAERETGVEKNEDLPWKERDHALFAGFAPYDNPKYAVSVIVEHGGSGAHQAAPIARDLLMEILGRT